MSARWRKDRKFEPYLAHSCVRCVADGKYALGLNRARTLAVSLAHVVGPTFFIGFATSFVMFLVLVPYCAFRVLGDVLGDEYLIRMFFVERLDKREDGVTN